MTPQDWLILVGIILALDLVALGVLLWIAVGLRRHIAGLAAHRSTIIELVRRGEESRNAVLQETHRVAAELVVSTSLIAAEVREEAQKRHAHLNERFDKLEEKASNGDTRLREIQDTGHDTNKKVTKKKVTRK